jgi:transposase
MTQRSRYRLSDAEKDALLNDQAALIEAQAARIKDLEARLSSPKKTSKNSHTPPSAGHKANARSDKSGAKKPRPSRPGVSRTLAENPDEVIQQRARPAAVAVRMYRSSARVSVTVILGVIENPNLMT